MKNRIKYLPSAVSELKSLRILDCSNNLIETLPGNIGALQSLKILNLRNNHLEYLVEGIGDLSELLYLDLRNNRLKEIPKSLLKLHKLEKLDLRYNQSLMQPSWLNEPQMYNYYLDCAKKTRKSMKTLQYSSTAADLAFDLYNVADERLNVIGLADVDITALGVFLERVARYGSHFTELDFTESGVIKERLVNSFPNISKSITTLILPSSMSLTEEEIDRLKVASNVTTLLFVDAQGSLINEWSRFSEPVTTPPPVQPYYSFQFNLLSRLALLINASVFAIGLAAISIDGGFLFGSSLMTCSVLTLGYGLFSQIDREHNQPIIATERHDQQFYL